MPLVPGGSRSSHGTQRTSLQPLSCLGPGWCRTGGLGPGPHHTGQRDPTVLHTAKRFQPESLKIREQCGVWGAEWDEGLKLPGLGPGLLSYASQVPQKCWAQGVSEGVSGCLRVWPGAREAEPHGALTVASQTA